MPKLIQPRRFVAGLLSVLLLVGPAHAQSAGGSAQDLAKLKSVALSIPTGSPVQVQMKDKSKVTGKIGLVDNTGFELQTLENGNIVSKKVGFDEIIKLSAGAPQSKLKSMAAPLLAVITLLGAVGAITAAVRAK